MLSTKAYGPVLLQPVNTVMLLGATYWHYGVELLLRES